MNESIENTPIVEPTVQPKNRSTTALVLFLFFALPMPLCLFIYHFVDNVNRCDYIVELEEPRVDWPDWPSRAGTCPVRCGGVVVAFYE